MLSNAGVVGVAAVPLPCTLPSFVPPSPSPSPAPRSTSANVSLGLMGFKKLLFSEERAVQ